MDVLKAAGDLRAIQHPSPIVTLALHRFVIAFLYAAYRGPRNVSALTSILDAGRFDPATVEKYAMSTRERFWLFHPDQPFLQDPRLPEELKDDVDSPASIFQLFREAAPPKGKMLFDHTVSGQGRSLSAAEAARYLIADQFFGLQDGRGYRPSMLTFGAAFFVTGRNLFETLALNLLPYNSEGPMKSANFEQDRASWEHDSLDPSPFPDGWLDYLTRPYRRLLLVSSDGSTVTSVYRKAASPLDREWRSQATDPWLAYRVTDGGLKPILLDPDRALWRESQTLFLYLSNREKGAPGYKNLLARLGRGAELNACGVVAGNNDIESWRHERLPLPPAYLQNEELLEQIERAVGLAEETGNILGEPFGWAARYLLIPNWDQLSSTDQKKQWRELTKKPGGKPSRVDNLFQTMNWERPYWSALDIPFRTLLVDLADAWPSDKQDAPLRSWAGAIRDAARDAFEAAARSLETSGRGLRAAAEARGRFGPQLNRTLQAFLPATREETPA